MPFGIRFYKEYLEYISYFCEQNWVIRTHIFQSSKQFIHDITTYSILRISFGIRLIWNAKVNPIFHNPKLNLLDIHSPLFFKYDMPTYEYL